MASRKKMDEGELAALLDDLISDAVDYEESELASQRERALSYYEADPDAGKFSSDVPYATGKSRVVSHDVADTHGWIMPGLMRVFLASDRVADYQPVGPEDEQWAKDATDGVNFLFLERCDGYHQLRSAIHDGLLLGNGILKHWWDHSPCYKVSTHTGLSEDEFVALVADDDVEVLEHTERTEEGGEGGSGVQGSYAGASGTGLDAGGGVLPPAAADPAGAIGANLGGIPVVVHDVKVKKTERGGQLRVQALPPEEFLIERDATRLDEEACRFAAHRSFPTRSELIKQGYDKADVDALPAYTANTDETAKTARDTLKAWGSTVQTDKSVERVEVFECYLLVDFDGDGVAEWRRIVKGNRNGKAGEEGASEGILANDPWEDDLPFTDLVPDAVPHRWRGRSLFDEAADIQRVKTVLKRQVLDNIYLTNSPQRIMLEGQIANPDEVVNPTIGGVIIAKRPDAIVDVAIPFVAEKAFGILEYLDAVLEKRTGVSRASMALDPEVLQNQTATAVNAQQSAAMSKVELYARNIAETGLKRLFKQLLKLVIKHQDGEFWIRRKGKPVSVDPTVWNADMDVSVNVGLGAGRREADMALLQAIAAKQEMVLQILGPDNPLCDLGLYRNTLAKMVEIGGVRAPELFFKEVDPAAVQAMMQAKAQQPDPKMLELQSKMQIEQQKLQAAAAQDQRKAEIEQVQAQADIATQQQKTQAELALAERRFELERELKILDHQLKREEHAMTAQFRAREHEADLAFKMRDQEVSHHYAERNQALKEQSQSEKAKGAE